MKKQHLSLLPADKSYLQKLLSKGSLPAKVFKRATALLELDRGKTFGEVAICLGSCYQSVSHWCEAYNTQGLSLLQDAPRSGRPIEIDGLSEPGSRPWPALKRPKDMPVGLCVCWPTGS